jgi:hypothetical protein
MPESIEPASDPYIMKTEEDMAVIPHCGVRRQASGAQAPSPANNMQSRRSAR